MVTHDVPPYAIMGGNPARVLSMRFTEEQIEEHEKKYIRQHGGGFILKAIHKVNLMLKSIPKTLYFNFKYLPIKEALKFPIIVSHRVTLQRMDGSIEFGQPIHFNMVRKGFHENPVFDQKRNRAVWNNAGKIVFNGTAYFGNGSCIANFGELKFGNNFQMSGNSSIVSKSDISFGDDVLIGWDCTFMDGDAHKVFPLCVGGYSKIQIVQ